MISTLIKYFKKVLILLLINAMVITGYTGTSFADYSENSDRPVDIVIRAGEWGNESTAKPGKRYCWGQDINISQHGISVKDIPSDIPLRKENNQWFISEFDINLKLAKAIAKKLDSKYNVDVNLQYAKDKTQDLNAAGRIARRSNPKIYLSVHHNAYKDDSTGYFIMSNQGDIKSAEYAKVLSKSFKDNGMIPQRSNRINDGYIGELNEARKSIPICILGEFGYFNKAEIVKICSDEYVNYVSDKVAESLYNQLQNMKNEDYKTSKDVINIVRDNHKQKEVVVKFGNPNEEVVKIKFE